jgi:uracil-DNA glycosylase
MTKQVKQKALDQIAQEIINCPICHRDKIGLAVPGEGNSSAKIVFVGEAPGKKEAASGRPFVGRAGQVLHGLIDSAGVKSEDVFITSAVKYLPTQTKPSLRQISHGRTHLIKQLNIIQPNITVLLGRVAALATLEKIVNLHQEHGRVVSAHGRKYLLTYHPASTLYSNKTQGSIREDFKELKKLLAK